MNGELDELSTRSSRNTGPSSWRRKNDRRDRGCGGPRGRQRHGSRRRTADGGRRARALSRSSSTGTSARSCAIAWYAIAALIYNGRWRSRAATESGRARGSVQSWLPARRSTFCITWCWRSRCAGARPASAGRACGSSRATARHLRSARTSRATCSASSTAFRCSTASGLSATLLTNDQVRVGDLAAGTLLVYDRGDELLASKTSGHANARLDTSHAEIVNELLARWDSPESGSAPTARASTATPEYGRRERER